MKKKKIKERLTNILNGIDTIDCKCKDDNLSNVYNIIVDIMEEM